MASMIINRSQHGYNRYRYVGIKMIIPNSFPYITLSLCLFSSHIRGSLIEQYMFKKKKKSTNKVYGLGN